MKNKKKKRLGIVKMEIIDEETGKVIKTIKGKDIQPVDPVTHPLAWDAANDKLREN